MTPTPHDHEALRIFDDLLAIPSPSGHESRMAAFLRERLAGLGYVPEMDPAGNVLVRLDGRSPDAPLCCIAAHMDEIGLVATAIEPDGALRVDRLGGTLPWKLGETAVEILGDHRSILGASSTGSGHSHAEASACPGWERVRILTGMSPDGLAEAGVRVGTPIVPARAVRGPFVFGEAVNPWVCAWTFDNRLSIACILRVLERFRAEGVTPRSPTIVAFTVEEETGCLGAKVLAQRERPEIFVAIDGSPLVPECPVALDGRPGIRSRDRIATYDQVLFRQICRIAADAGVELQPVVYAGAASDASLVYSVGASPRVACLGYVRASSHGFEVAPLKTFDLLETATEAILREL